MIDEEARDIVERAHSRATRMLTKHRETMDRVVQALLERETLDRDEFLAVLNNREMPPREPETPSEPPASGTPATSESTNAPMPISPPRFEPA
jgi:cell division protease FtsH